MTMKTPAGASAGLLAPDDPRLPDPYKTMLDATPDCIKILSPDGTLLSMNKAGCLALNVPLDSDFGMAWLPLLPQGVHAAGQAALRQAAAGQAVRFPGESASPQGTMFWDNLLIPMVDGAGGVLRILCVSRDVTEKVLAQRQLDAALERERLLAREMQHRIKNLFSVVSGLTYIAEKEARSAGTPDSAVALLRGKLGALARASDAVFAQDPAPAADGHAADLQALVRSVLQPYGEQCRLEGGPATVRADAMTTLALFLHELATNSMKYGALGASGGSVAIRWTASADVLEFSWHESGGPSIAASPAHRGFGSEMVDRIMHAAGGKVARSWEPQGLRVELRLPRLVQPG